MAILSVDRRAYRPFRLLILPVIVLLLLFAGLQTGLGDYVSYEYLYNQYYFKHFGFPFYKSIDGSGTGHEYIYVTISTIFSTIGLPFSVFFFFICFLTVGLKLAWIKKYSPYFFISLLVYLALILIKDMTQIRAQVATSIIFLAIYFVVNNNPLKYVFMIALASGFHIFALSALPIYWLCNSKYLKKTLYIFLFFGFLISITGGFVSLIVDFVGDFLLGPVQAKFIRLYQNKLTQSVNPFGIGALFLLFWVVFGFLNWSSLEKNKFMKCIFVFFIYGIVNYMLFAELGLISFRFLEMYSHLSLAILLPFFIRICKFWSRVFVIFISIAYSIFFIVAKIEQTQDYRNILFS